MIWIALFGVVSVLGLGVFALHLRYPELRWDWSSIDTGDVDFPADFLWGSATAAHQVEGNMPDNNWTWWETQKDSKGRWRIHEGAKVGAAAPTFAPS